MPKWWPKMSKNEKAFVKSLVHGERFSQNLLLKLIDHGQMYESDAQEFLNWWFRGREVSVRMRVET